MPFKVSTFCSEKVNVLSLLKPLGLRPLSRSAVTLKQIKAAVKELWYVYVCLCLAPCPKPDPVT